MMRKALYTLLVVTITIGAVSLSGCKDSEDITATATNVLVGLERTACYGRCPVYALSVAKTGEATLVVGPFCEEVFGRSMELGTHRANVDVGVWTMVADMAYDMGFDTLKTRYDDPNIMDVPANILTVNEKTVYNRFGGPKLNLLYMRIEQLIGTVDWQADPSSAR